MTDRERDELEELRQARKVAAALGVELTVSAREAELEELARQELEASADELGVELLPYAYSVVGGSGRTVGTFTSRADADEYARLHPAFRVLELPAA